MSDTAAFFALKKKKKKTFKKFNANKVDVSQVTSTQHVDAPAVSSEAANAPSTKSLSITKGSAEGGDWDEGAFIAKAQKNAPSSSSGGAAELMDMKALEIKRSEQDDIVEKLRVEETKAQLAAARENTKKEAVRMKEEQEAKEAKKAEVSSRFEAAASNMAGGGGSRWVPVHQRNAPRSVMPTKSSTGYQRKVDTNDEELFPDLATADKLIAQEEEQKQKMAARRSKPSASPWGAKKAAPAPAPAKAPVEVENVEEKVEKKEEPAPAAASSTPAVAAGIKKKPTKKKKKKDLSTFKAS